MPLPTAEVTSPTSAAILRPTALWIIRVAGLGWIRSSSPHSGAAALARAAQALIIVIVLPKGGVHPGVDLLRFRPSKETLAWLGSKNARICSRLGLSAACIWMIHAQHAGLTPLQAHLAW